MFCQEDEKFLTEVFAQLTDEATEASKRRELVSTTILVCVCVCLLVVGSIGVDVKLLSGDKKNKVVVNLFSN